MQQPPFNNSGAPIGGGWTPAGGGSQPGNPPVDPQPPGGQYHPELNRLLDEYDKLTDAVTNQAMTYDQAMELLGALQVADAAGSMWGLDEHAQFTRRMTPDSAAVIADPSQFATHPGSAPAPTAPPPAGQAGFSTPSTGGWSEQPVAGQDQWGGQPAPSQPMGGQPAWGSQQMAPQQMAGQDQWGGGQQMPGQPMGGQPAWGSQQMAPQQMAGQDQWGGGQPAGEPQNAGKPKGPGAGEKVVALLKQYKTTSIIVAVGVALILAVFVTRGGDDTTPPPADPPADLPADEPVPAPDEEQASLAGSDVERVVEALNTGQSGSINQVIANPGEGGVPALEAARWYGMSELNFSVELDEAEQRGASATQAGTVNDAEGATIAVVEFRWEQNDDDEWVLSRWPSFERP